MTILIFLLFSQLGYAMVKSDIRFTCVTTENTIRIERIGEDQWRYRSWDSGRAISAEPNLELLNGKVVYTGTGPCSHPTYSFVHAGLSYEVEPFGCTSGEVPEKAVGSFTIKEEDTPLKTLWCFGDV